MRVLLVEGASYQATSRLGCCSLFVERGRCGSQVVVGLACAGLAAGGAQAGMASNGSSLLGDVGQLKEEKTGLFKNVFKYIQKKIPSSSLKKMNNVFI